MLGEKMKPPVRPPATPIKQQQPDKLLIFGIVAYVVLLGVVFAIFVVWLLGILTAPSVDSGSGPPGDSYTAYLMAQQFVGKRLKAPSTATFPRISEAYILYDEEGSTWQVFSYVDSQNSFGAMIRMRWSCQLYTGDGEQWTLHEIKFDE